VSANGKLKRPGWSQRPGGRPYQKHGLVAAKRALERGLELDGRTRLGRAMQAARVELVEDLGGLDGISARQRGLVDAAVQLKVLADSAASWVFQQPSIVNGRRKALYPIVGELASLLTRYAAVLKDLGLERRVRDADPLEAVRRAVERANAPTPTEDAA